MHSSLYPRQRDDRYELRGNFSVPHIDKPTTAEERAMKSLDFQQQQEQGGGGGKGQVPRPGLSTGANTFFREKKRGGGGTLFRKKNEVGEEIFRLKMETKTF